MRLIEREALGEKEGGTSQPTLEEKKNTSNSAQRHVKEKQDESLQNATGVLRRKWKTKKRREGRQGWGLERRRVGGTSPRDDPEWQLEASTLETIKIGGRTLSIGETKRIEKKTKNDEGRRSFFVYLCNPLFDETLVVVRLAASSASGTQITFTPHLRAFRQRTRSYPFLLSMRQLYLE